MYKKPNKKQQVLRRVLFSALATTSVLIIATVAVLFMLGFRLDSGNGRLQQGALVQFDSVPSAADVWIDGNQTGSRTASKTTVLAGMHEFKMTKNGYDSWSRTLDLKAGTLTWLDYIRLVPTSRTPTDVLAFANVAGMTTSPDRKAILVQEQVAVPSFSLVDISTEKVTNSLLELPESLYSDATTATVQHIFSLGSWNKGGRYTLVKHSYNDQTEWIVLDTQNMQQSVNITRLLSVNFTDVQFAGTSGRSLYGLTTDGVLRKIDVSGATISRGLVSQVDTFTVFDSNLVSYEGRNAATERVVGVYRDGDELPHVLRTAPADANLRIAIGKYFSDDFVAIAEGAVVTILKGSYATSSDQSTSNLKEFGALELTTDVTSLSFSFESGYVIAQAGAAFASYELEHHRSAAGSMRVPDGATATTLRWLDTAYLWNDDGGTLVMRDFDNANSYDIMPVAPGFEATLSQSGRFFYAIGKTDTGYQLQRVKMILE